MHRFANERPQQGDAFFDTQPVTSRCGQAHPEFEEEYELALLEMYSGNVVPKRDVDLALDRILGAGEKADTQMLTEWIAEFLLSRQL